MKTLIKRKNKKIKWWQTEWWLYCNLYLKKYYVVIKSNKKGICLDVATDVDKPLDQEMQFIVDNV